MKNNTQGSKYEHTTWSLPWRYKQQNLPFEGKCMFIYGNESVHSNETLAVILESAISFKYEWLFFVMKKVQLDDAYNKH